MTKVILSLRTNIYFKHNTHANKRHKNFAVKLQLLIRNTNIRQKSKN